MIVLASFIVLLRELIVSTIFRMVHPYITIHSVEGFLHLYAYGTARARREFPVGLRSVTLEHGEHGFYQRGHLVVVVWMDRKPVMMLSTVAQPEVTHTQYRESRKTEVEPLCSVKTR